MAIGSIAAALALGALVLPSASSATIVGTHVVTPQTVAPHVVTPSAAPAPAPAPTPSPAPAPAPVQSLTSPNSPYTVPYTAPPPNVILWQRPDGSPATPVTDPSCDVDCKGDWRDWIVGQVLNTDMSDPNGPSRVAELKASLESIHQEIVGIYAEELGPVLDSMMHPFGPAPATQTSPPDPSQGGSQDPDGSGAPAQTPSTNTPATTTSGGNGVSFISELTGFISGAVCPKGNFQSVNNGVEDNTGASGACF